MPEIYLASARENRIAETIAALEPCQLHGRIMSDRVQSVVGEVGNVGLESTCADADLAGRL